jgi:ring-1,2-phenylacetyl-CoA epoxidase subunit PaaD
MVDATDTEISTLWATPETLLSQIWHWLENVCDPEVPVLSVLDLGVVRQVTLQHPQYSMRSSVEERLPVSATITPTVVPIVIVHITPTYTGCPAMNMIAANIRLELLAHGLKNVQVLEVLSPPWTTDWMSAAGRQKLLAYGIAPPQSKARLDKMLFSDIPVPCPQCGSNDTELISEFGSTACKSLHRCLACREPFDAFKCH